MKSFKEFLTEGSNEFKKCYDSYYMNESKNRSHLIDIIHQRLDKCDDKQFSNILKVLGIHEFLNGKVVPDKETYEKMTAKQKEFKLVDFDDFFENPKKVRNDLTKIYCDDNMLANVQNLLKNSAKDVKATLVTVAPKDDQKISVIITDYYKAIHSVVIIS